MTFWRRSSAALSAEAVRASAHAIKGAALNVGAITVGDQARRIEEAAKLRVFDDLETLVEGLSVAIPPAARALNGDTHTGSPSQRDEDSGVAPRQPA